MKISTSFFNRSIFSWLELILLVALFSGILILVNYIAFRHNRRFDLTPEKIYSLSPQTIQILQSLTDDVSATIFYKQKEDLETKDIMDLFSMASRHFRYSFMDLEKNPATAEALGINSYGAGIISYKGKKEKVQYFNEHTIVSAIIRLTDKNDRIVRFVSGHGEKDITNVDSNKGYSMVGDALKSENYKVESTLLMQIEKIPDDTFVLIISGPQKDFFQKELDEIDAYLRKGGRALMLFDPCPLPNIEKYLESLNIQLARDFIIDKKSKLLGLDELTPIITPDKKNPIAKNMNDEVVFPVCRSVLPLDQGEIEVIAQSGPGSWAERNTQSVYDDKAFFDAKDKDIKGPVSVAVATKVQPITAGEQKNASGYLIVMGNSNFVSNHYINVLGNKDFFLNSVNWLSDKKELLSTRPKTGQAPVSMLFLTENENRLVMLSSVVIEPGIILLIGIIVVFWRRIKR